MGWAGVLRISVISPLPVESTPMAIQFEPIKDFSYGLDLSITGRFLHRVSGLPLGVEVQVYRKDYQWRVKVIRGASVKTWFEGYSTLDQVKAAIERRFNELQR